MTVPKTLVDQKLLSTGEVAKLMNVHRGTVWNWIKKGMLKRERVTDRYSGVSKKSLSDFKRTYRQILDETPPVSPKGARTSEKTPRRKPK